MNKKEKRLRQDVSAGKYLAPEIMKEEIEAINVLCQSDQNITYGGYTKGEEEGN